MPLDLGFGVQCITIYCENQAPVNLTKYPSTVSRKQHVDTAYHLLRNRGSRGELVIDFVGITNQFVDFLAKPVGPTKLSTVLHEIGHLPWQVVSRG